MKNKKKSQALEISDIGYLARSPRDKLGVPLTEPWVILQAPEGSIDKIMVLSSLRA